MKNITLHFHSSDTIISRAIQFWLKGAYSHVSAELDGFYYHYIMGRDNYATKLRDDDIVESITFQVPPPTFDTIQERLNSTLGGSYDYLSVLGFILNFQVQDKDWWFCSEMAKYILDYMYDVPTVGSKLITPTEIYISLKSYMRGLEK